jgi:hypothetical protein
LIVPVRMSLEKAGEVRKIMDAHPGMSEGAARKILAGLEAEASKGGALLTGEEAMEPFLPSDLKAEALDPWAREEMSPAASEELRKFWDSDTCRNLKEMEGSPIPWLAVVLPFSHRSDEGRRGGVGAAGRVPGPDGPAVAPERFP